MADALVFGAGFAPSEVAAMPLSMIVYWARRRVLYGKMTNPPQKR